MVTEKPAPQKSRSWFSLIVGTVAILIIAAFISTTLWFDHMEGCKRTVCSEAYGPVMARITPHKHGHGRHIALYVGRHVALLERDVPGPGPMTSPFN